MLTILPLLGVLLQPPSGPYLVWDAQVVDRFDVCVNEKCTDVGATPWANLKGPNTYALPLTGLLPSGVVQFTFVVKACNVVGCADSDPLVVTTPAKPTGLGIK